MPWPPKVPGDPEPDPVDDKDPAPPSPPDDRQQDGQSDASRSAMPLMLARAAPLSASSAVPAAKTLAQSGPASVTAAPSATPSGTPVLDRGSVYLTAGAVDRETRRYVYDEFGQVVAQRIYDRDMKALYQVTSYQYDADGNNLSYKVTANLTEKSELLYSNVYAQTFTGIGAQRQLTRIEVSSSNAQFKAGQTNQHYTADGRLFSVDNRDASYKRFFADDEGMVLKASTADTSGAASPQRAEERQLVVNSQVVQRWGYAADESRPKDDKGLPRYGQISVQSHSVDRIDLSTSVGQLNSVSVQSGDTLRSVAQRVYGDTSKWYLLAQANGMAADDQLAAGTSLQVPHQVSGTHNSADTFKPYDPSKVIGDTSPYMAQAPQADKGCGTFGQLLMIVVAVVVAVYTAGAGSWALGLEAMQAGSGMAVLGAMAGSAASQLVGMATGDVKKFSWGAVLQAGATAYVAPAIMRANLFQAGEFTVTNKVLSAMASNALVQGASVKLHFQEHFNMKGVVAAGATSYMDSEVFKNSPSMSESVTASTFGYRLMQASVNSLISQGIKTGKWQPNQVTADALGAAIGDSIKQAGASGEVDEVVARARLVGGSFADYVEATDRGDILVLLAKQTQSSQRYDTVLKQLSDKYNGVSSNQAPTPTAEASSTSNSANNPAAPIAPPSSLTPEGFTLGPLVYTNEASSDSKPSKNKDNVLSEVATRNTKANGTVFTYTDADGKTRQAPGGVGVSPAEWSKRKEITGESAQQIIATVTNDPSAKLVQLGDCLRVWIQNSSGDKLLPPNYIGEEVQKLDPVYISGKRIKDAGDGLAEDIKKDSKAIYNAVRNLPKALKNKASEVKEQIKTDYRENGLFTFAELQLVRTAQIPYQFFGSAATSLTHATYTAISRGYDTYKNLEKGDKIEAQHSAYEATKSVVEVLLTVAPTMPFKVGGKLLGLAENIGTRTLGAVETAIGLERSVIVERAAGTIGRVSERLESIKASAMSSPAVTQALEVSSTVSLKLERAAEVIRTEVGTSRAAIQEFVTNVSEKASAARAAAEIYVDTSSVMSPVRTLVQQVAEIRSFVAGPGYCKPSKVGCFVAGTPILLEDGRRIPIEQVEPGHVVLARPETGGDIAPARVARIVRLGEKSIWTLKVRRLDDGQQEELHLTPNHPLWVVGAGWAAAEELDIGDTLVTADDRDAVVVSCSDTGTLQAVYNFEVEGLHTYHVGELGVWVHNTDCFEGFIQAQKTSPRQAAVARVERGGVAGGPSVPNKPTLNITALTPRDIPTFKSGQFNSWFDARTPEQVSALYQNPALREKIEDGLRGAGGNHEFLMVAEAPQWSQWGVRAGQVQEDFAISISALNEGGLAKGWTHSTGLKGSKSPNSKKLIMSYRKSSKTQFL